MVPLFRYGSVEFRAIRTPKDFTTIYPWLELFAELRENARTFSNPIAVVEQFSGGGYVPFVKNLLPNNHKFVLSGSTNTEEKLMRGVRLAQEIAYSTTNWEG
jgi:hypothetical protein